MRGRQDGSCCGPRTEGAAGGQRGRAAGPMHRWMAVAHGHSLHPLRHVAPSLQPIPRHPHQGRLTPPSTGPPDPKQLWGREAVCKWQGSCSWFSSSGDSHLGFPPHRGKRRVTLECPAGEATKTTGHAPLSGYPSPGFGRGEEPSLQNTAQTADL